jgi:hypothetical protein
MKPRALGADQTVAWALARQINAELQKGQGPAPGSVRWLFTLFEQDERFGRLAPSTKKDYLWLGRLLCGLPVGGVALGGFPAGALKPRHADRLYEALCLDHGKATAHYACRYARRVWNWGGRRDHVDRRDNPWARMELQGIASRKQRWSAEQIEAVIAAAREMGWPSMALAVLLSWRATLRQGDVIGLTWTALDQRQVGTRKTGEVIPLVAGAYPDLAAALAATPRTGVQVVICEATKRPWRQDHFRHVFREVAKAAGVPDDLQFRDLRATGLTELADSGADEIGLSSHGGHKTPQMRRRYVRFTPEQFERAAEARVAAEGRRNRRRNSGNDDP